MVKKGHGNNNMTEDWKHNPSLSAEDIVKIIREGREENDKKFDTYGEYADFIVKDNQKILDKLGSDYDENGVPYWDKWSSKQIGDEFEREVLKDLEDRGFDLINRNVHVKGTGCEVDFVARKSYDQDDIWYVEAKGGYKGGIKRPGAQRTDNVKKAIASFSLIRSLYPSLHCVIYFSATPKRGSYSEEMINLALRKRIINDVIYLESKTLQKNQDGKDN